MSDYPNPAGPAEGYGNGYPPEPSHEQRGMRPADTGRHGDGTRPPTPTYEPIPAQPVWQDQPEPTVARSAASPGIETQERFTVHPMGADEGDWDDGPWVGPDCP